jgi:DNA-binding transcriptional MerR regulator
MPTKETAPLTYTIKEASGLSGLPESTLRYYETIGIIDAIKRDASSKHRVYDEDDLNIIVAIACLSATGMSLDDMRAYLKNRDQGVKAADKQVGLLEAQKRKLAAEAHFLKFRRAYVDLKIGYWQAVGSGQTKEAESIAKQARVIADELKLPKE